MTPPTPKTPYSPAASVSFLDVETAPESPEVLQRVKPTFEPARNLKDPAKIAESIAAKERDWLDSAALDALTGQVLCVGILHPDGLTFIDGPEPKILTRLWGWVSCELFGMRQIVGFCCHRFDWPFLVRRSLLHQIHVPAGLRQGRYWNANLIDIAEEWSCGNRDQTVSLDALSKYLGVGQKTGNGADFARLWAEDRQKALAYLENDLRLIAAVWERFSACLG